MFKFLRDIFTVDHEARIRELKIEARYLRQLNSPGRETSQYFLEREMKVLKELARYNEVK